MKKLLYLFSASLLLFTSCSDNDNNSSGTTAIFPKTRKITYPDSPTWNSTSTFVYNGNKIVSFMMDASYRADYTYDGNVIVKQISYDIVNGQDVKTSEMTYTYANNKLATSTSQNPESRYKNKLVYTYNSDRTVTIDGYQDLYDINTTITVETKTFEVVITLVNGNLVKSVNSYGYVNEYVYDSKNSPFKNILGSNLLLDNSMNNATKQTVTYGSTNVYRTDYVYNADGYPTKATLYRSDGITVNYIIEYTY